MSMFFQDTSTARRRRLTMAGLALPSILMMALVNGYPVVVAAVQSVHDGGLLKLGDFVGVENYIRVFRDPLFWKSLRFTVLFAVCGVFGSWVVGFSLALFLRTRFPGSAIFRVLLLLPWIVPIVVTAMGWNWLVATRNSIMPQLAEALGFGPVMFLADPTMAVITVCVFKIWISYPFMMMMAAGALETVDQSAVEAARVDGAGPWSLLIHMILPMTARSTYISWILMTMFSVNDFPTIFLLTGGGPVNATSSLVVMAYRTVFQDFQPGYGIAITFVITTVLAVLSLCLFNLIRKSSVS
ncbi:carbohydrate ABC transporter permease [Martelella soudanensis]|uniref:carbohydrate ABC transporter permease n=1 Tax=unclassified Martelella TaxID=2629616 RepID=UPI001FEE51FB|nr:MULTISPECIES: sugar ABC transporter permease [unclassified Martelella]